jgi:hypothetical protein
VSRVRFAAAPLAWHLARCVPWLPLLAGCCLGSGLSLAMAATAREQDPRLVLTVVRVALVPVLAGLAFLLDDRHWQLAGSLPVPGWLSSAGRVLLAAPVVALTCWLQLDLGDRALARTLAGSGQHAVIPALQVSVEFAAGCAITLAAAAVVQRSRWHDLGGAAAVPLALAAAAGLAASPWHLLPTAFPGRTGPLPPGWTRPTLLTALVVVLAAIVAAWSSRDRWRRAPAIAWRPSR